MNESTNEADPLDSTNSRSEEINAIDFGGMHEDNQIESPTEGKSGFQKKPSDFPSFRIQMDEEIF